MQTLFIYVAGLIFGVGLCLSGMNRPEKDLGFLDVAGLWDPSLAFVMIGAIGDLTSLRVAFSVGAAGLVTCFVALTIRSRHWRAALDGAPKPTGGSQSVSGSGGIR